MAQVGRGGGTAGVTLLTSERAGAAYQCPGERAAPPQGRDPSQSCGNRCKWADVMLLRVCD